MLVDTHAHLYLEQFAEDRAKVIQCALDENVRKIALPNIDSQTLDSVYELADQYPEVCYPMLGLHPCSVKENYRDELEHLFSRIEERPLCAIGEIGLDFYWDKQFIKEQEQALLIQIEWAMQYDLPIVIHSRESTDRNIEIIQDFQDQVRGVFHCFTGTLEQARQIIDMGFLLGIGGVLTFKNSGLDQVVRDLPLSSLVLETDAPYLTPTPHRGKRNESSYVSLIVTKLAEVLSCSLEEVTSQTTQNAMRLYPLIQATSS